jgi:tRNA G18 (ribose-2'-O)-methylase SpoU
LGALTGAAASVVDRAYCDVSQQVNALRLFTEGVCAVGIPQVATVVSADVVKAIYQGANNLLNSWVTSLHAAMPPACSSEVFDSVCDAMTTSIAILVASDSLEEAVFEMNINEWVAVLNRIYTCNDDAKATTPPPYSGVIARSATRALHALCVPYAALKETGYSPSNKIAKALRRVLPTALPVLLRNPSPLAGTAAEAELAGFDNTGIIQSMISRYTLTVLLCITSAVSDGSEEDRLQGAPQLCSGVLGEWSLDVVDISAANNLPQLFALIAAVSKLVVSTMSPVPSAVEDAFVLVWSRQRAPERRAAIRCSAIAYQMLSVLSEIDCGRAIQFARDVISNEAETDRAVFFASLVSCSSALNQMKASSTVDASLVDLIVQQCCIVNRGFIGDNEMENCVAVVETPFLSWPEAVRKAFPASPAVVSVARALSLSTLLHICKTSSEEVAPAVFTKLIGLLKSHPDVIREPCMPNSKAHRCRLRILQLLGLMVPLITSGSPAFQDLTAFLFDTALLQNNMGSVRKHYEILAIRVLVTCPANIVPHLSRHLSNFDLKAQAGASFAKVAINVMLHLQLGEVQHDLHGAPLPPSPLSSRDIYNFLTRLGNSYQHLMRIIAHIGSHSYLSKEKSVRGVESLDEDQVRYLEYLNTAGEVLKFRDKHYDVVVFDWDMELLPSSLLCVQRMEGQYWLQDSIGWETFWRCGELVNEVSSVLRMGYPVEGLIAGGVVRSLFGDCEDTTVNTMMTALLHDGLIPAMSPSSDEANNCFTGLQHTKSTLCFSDALKQLSLAHDRLSGKQGGANHARAEEDNDDLPDGGAADSGAEANTNMQRKVQSWWTSEVYNELHPRSLGRAQRQPLIIVGSLLENPVNIAGLCRCADIFAVEGVVVPNKRVFEHPHFIAAARSAEKWIQWEEVPETGLIAYLRRKKQKGYTAVGIEQTADSESMASYQFPERAVVVLGSEGKGIPPGILPFLDVCVEIPQFGLIRFLNVHVTGALAMYEYTKQHLMASSSSSQ